MKNARHLTFLLALLAIPALAAPPGEQPRAVSWDALCERCFDTAWILPDDCSDLVTDMKALATRRFDRAGSRAWPRSMGDLLRSFRSVRDDPERREALLRRLRRERPEVYREVSGVLTELVRDDVLVSEDWDPDDDEKRDGMVIRRPFRRDTLGVAPWNEFGGSRDVFQAAAVIWADLDTIKEVENDYATYPDHVGSDYEEIHALPGQYVRARDPSGRPAASLAIFFRTDLPWPYGETRCHLRILNRLDSDGHLVTDVYSKSRDFYWLAGRDLYVPVYDSNRVWVGTLAVRLYGFDIRSVPDGDGHRLEALRGTLGNLKRKADRLFSQRGGKPRTTSGDVPRFVVRGVKRD